MNDKTTALDSFYNEYKKLNETDKKLFSKIVNKLLSDTFIIKDKSSDRTDYLYARDNVSTLTSYFTLTDYEFIYDRYNELCYIKTTENRNRVRLDKFDTALILVFRQFYYIKRKEVSIDNRVIVQLEEIKEKINTSKIFEKDKRITPYDVSLRKLRTHKIIDYSATKITDNLTIQILPSIQIIVQQDSLEDITTRIRALKNITEDVGDETDEDTNED